MAEARYNQFCPVAMAAEILCTRWTMIVLREIMSGSRRFNDIRRGAPRMSPALLSRRLKELEAAGVIVRKPLRGDSETFEYHFTDAGRELEPLIMGFGAWGQRWVDKDVSLQHLDAQLLMWDMRRNLNAEPMPARRSVIQFQFPEQSPARRLYWLIVTPGEEVDLCSVDPGHDVDLYVSTDLRTMTAIWMGHDTVRRAQDAGALHLTGDRALGDKMQTWLGLSPLAQVPRVD